MIFSGLRTSPAEKSDGETHRTNPAVKAGEPAPGANLEAYAKGLLGGIERFRDELIRGGPGNSDRRLS